jgi:hypothetical protein
MDDVCSQSFIIILLYKQNINYSKKLEYVLAKSLQIESLFLCRDGNTFRNFHHIELRSKDVKSKDFPRVSYTETF